MLKQFILTGAAISALLPFTIHPAKAKSNCTNASHYGIGDGYHGNQTANGERFNAYGLTAAHRNLPFGSKLVVTNVNNGKSVKVRINDRGPFHSGRGLDLSYGAFAAIDSPSRGEVRVCWNLVA